MDVSARTDWGFWIAPLALIGPFCVFSWQRLKSWRIFPKDISRTAVMNLSGKKVHNEKGSLGYDGGKPK
jgi:hypothetical protein